MGDLTEDEKDWKIREKELELFTEYMDKVIQSVGTMKKALSYYCADSMDSLDEKQAKVIKLEKEADEIKLRIIARLIKNSSLPKVKENFINLLFICDEIPENSRAAVVKMSNLRQCNPGEKVEQNLQELTDCADRTVRILKKAVLDLLKKNFRESIERSEDIENIEEETRQLRRTELNPGLSSWSEKEPNPANTGLFLDMINNIEKTAGRAKKAADTIRKIASSQI